MNYLKRACDRQQPLRPHAQAFNNLSVALLNLGRLDAALNAVQDAIKLAGKQLAFIVNRANVYELQGDLVSHGARIYRMLCSWIRTMSTC